MPWKFEDFHFSLLRLTYSSDGRIEIPNVTQYLPIFTYFFIFISYDLVLPSFRQWLEILENSSEALENTELTELVTVESQPIRKRSTNSWEI